LLALLRVCARSYVVSGVLMAPRARSIKHGTPPEAGELQPAADDLIVWSYEVTWVVRVHAPPRRRAAVLSSAHRCTAALFCARRAGEPAAVARALGPDPGAAARGHRRAPQDLLHLAAARCARAATPPPQRTLRC
jgi:hypothetical protein